MDAIDLAVRNAQVDLKQEVRKLLINGLVQTSPGNGRDRHFDCSTDELLKVAHFLSQHRFDYSLSVFVAESRLDTNRLFERGSQSNGRNVDLKEVAELLWRNLNGKYAERLKQLDATHGADVQDQLSRLKREQRRVLQLKEQQLDDAYSAKLAALRDREQKLCAEVEEQKELQSKATQAERRELLEQVRELERRRNQLQQLENDFARKVEEDGSRVRAQRDDAASREAALQRRELRLDERVSRAVADAKSRERERYARALQRLVEREARLRCGADRVAGALQRLDGVRRSADDAHVQLQDRQAQIGQLESDNERLLEANLRLHSKLRAMSDYERTKREATRLRAELDQVSTAVDNNPRVASLESEIVTLREQACLAEKKMALEEDEHKLRIEQERARYNDLSVQFKAQSQQLKEMAKEIAKLRDRLPFARSAATFEPKRAVAARFERSLQPMAMTSSEELSETAETTPEIVVDARNRLRQLDADSERLNRSLNAYNVAKAAARSSYPIAAGQSVVAVSTRPDFSVAAEPIALQPADAVLATFDREAGDDAQLSEAIHKVTAPPQSVQPLSAKHMVLTSTPRKAGTSPPPRSPVDKRQAERRNGTGESDWLERLRARKTDRPDWSSIVEPRVEDTPVKAASASEAVDETPIDPVMQRYMSMVLEQRQKAQEESKQPGEYSARDKSQVDENSVGPIEQNITQRSSGAASDW